MEKEKCRRKRKIILKNICWAPCFAGIKENTDLPGS